MHRSIVTSVAMAQILLAGTVLAAEENYGPLKTQATTIGKVLADPNGMTLYTYDKDGAGQSNCNGECAQYWHPYLAAPDSKPFGHMTLVVRTDGKKQWAYENKPLYTFVQDTVPGEIKGNDFHNNWHVVVVSA